MPSGLSCAPRHAAVCAAFGCCCLRARTACLPACLPASCATDPLTWPDLACMSPCCATPCPPPPPTPRFPTCLHPPIQLAPPGQAGSNGDVGRLAQQLDPLHWRQLSADAAWLLFESLLKACRSAHQAAATTAPSQPALQSQQGGLLAQVRGQLPSAAALESWQGVGTLFS